MEDTGRIWARVCSVVLLVSLVVVGWASPDAQAQQRFNGVTLHLLMYGSPPTLELQKLLPNFERSTGITVKVEIAPYNDMHEKELLDLGSGTNSYDVMTMDNPWLPEMVATGNVLNLTVPFDKAPASFRSGFIPGILKAYGEQNGKLWAWPFQPGAQLLFYRKDVFSKYAAQYKTQTGHELVPPVNWDDFLRVARFFTKKDNPNSPTSYGTAIALQKGNAAVNMYAEVLWGIRGNEFNCQWQATLNNATGLKALNILKDVAGYAQPSAPTDYWDEASRVFESGDAAMLLQWDAFSGDLVNPKISKVWRDVGFAPLPGGVSSLGGWAMIVNKNSRHADAAVALAEWIASPQIAVPFTKNGGLSARTFVFTDPSLVQAFPWLPTDLKVYQNVRRRTSPEANGPTIIPESTYETIEGTAVNQALTGQLSPDAAMKQAEDQLDKLVAPLQPKFGGC
jgi:multiple sugar transport system substrate-binding protein